MLAGGLGGLGGSYGAYGSLEGEFSGEDEDSDDEPALHPQVYE
jgi:hypothetical protein